MVEERLNAIADGHLGIPRIIETERDKIPSYWGFCPRNGKNNTFAKINADVKAHPKYYDEPLKHFKDKLLHAAMEWAKHHDLDWDNVKLHLENRVWPGKIDSSFPVKR